MSDFDNISAEELAKQDLAAGKTPEETADLVRFWVDQASDGFRKEFGDSGDYFQAKDALASSSTPVLQALHSQALRDWKAKKLPELLPDAIDQVTFLMAAQKGIPDDIALQNLPKEKADAFKDLETVLRNPVFAPAEKSQTVPITAPSSGAVLGRWRGYPKRDGSVEVQVLIPNKDKEDTVRLEIQPVTQEDYEGALQSAISQYNNAVKAEQTASRIEAGIFEKVFGGGAGELPGSGKTVEETRRSLDEANARLSELEKGPEDGKALLASERIEEAIKNPANGIANKLGTGALAGAIPDIARGIASGLVNQGIGVLDATGLSPSIGQLTGWTPTDSLRELRQEIEQAIPGSTGTDFRDETMPRLFRTAFEAFGQMLPTFVPSSVGARAQEVTGLTRSVLPDRMANWIEQFSTSVARKGGLALGVGAQTYGARMADMLNDADAAEASGNPGLAKRLRENARTAAASDAVVEMFSEGIFREDELIRAAAQRGGLMSRAGRSALKFGVENAVEEVVAESIQGGITGPLFQGTPSSGLSGILEAGAVGFLIGAPIGAIQGMQASQQVRFAEARRDFMVFQQRKLQGEIDTLKSAMTGPEDVEARAFIDEREGVKALFAEREAFWKSEHAKYTARKARDDGEPRKTAVNAVGGAVLENSSLTASTESIKAEAEAVLDGTPTLAVQPEEDVLDPASTAPTVEATEEPVEDSGVSLPENLDAEREKEFLLKQRPGLTETKTVPEPYKRLATNFEQRTGVRTVFVRGDSAQGGLSRPGGKAIIVNLDNPRSTKLLVGHEIGHTVEEDPEFKAVFDLIQTNEKINRYRSKIASFYGPEEFDTEFRADVLGEFGQQRSFWREVEQSMPATVFQRLHDAVLDGIDSMLQSVREFIAPTGRGKALPAIENLLQVRRALASVLRQRGELNLTQGDRILQAGEAPVRDSRSLASPNDFKSKDGVREILSKGGWAIMTAENPNAVEATAEENKVLLRGLKQDLKSQGLSYTPVIGQYGARENSLIVFDPSMGVDRAQELATRYAQESVLTREGLVYANGDILPASGVEVFDQKPEDFYTQVGDITFSVQFSREFGDPLKAGTPENQAAREAVDSRAAGRDKLIQSVWGNDQSPKFTTRQEVTEFIKTHFSPKMNKIGAGLVSNLAGYDARYVWSGTQGGHYVEYNPLALVGETHNSLRAIMREEMIHAAEGAVIRQNLGTSDQVYLDHYRSVARSLSKEDRALVKKVYRSTRNEADVGVEFSRMVIQQALYGSLTESWRASPKALSKIADLIRLTLAYLKRILGRGPEDNAILRDAVKILRKVDAAAKGTIRQSISLPSRIPVGVTKSPIENHKDFGFNVTGRNRARLQTLEEKVMWDSGALQRGFPENWATIQNKPNEDIQWLYQFAGGTRTAIYEHIGDLYHRAFDSLHAMRDKVNVHALRHKELGRRSLETEFQEEWKSNWAYSLMPPNYTRDDLVAKLDGPVPFEIVQRAQLADLAFAAMYSRLKAYTPLQAAGRNMAIAAGMGRWSVYDNLATAIKEYIDSHPNPGAIDTAGFDIDGVNNLSRSNNETGAQWETTLRLAANARKSPEILGDAVGSAKHALRDSISHQDLVEPIALMEAASKELAALAPSVRQSISLPGKYREGRLTISTRIPSARNSAEGFTEVLKADLAALQNDPDFMAKIAAGLRNFPQVVNARIRNPERVIRELIDTMKGNLRFLWDIFPEELRERAGKWYEGAHALANDIAAASGLTPEQVSAIIAVLSPQKDWFQNLSLAERTIVIASEADRTNPSFNENLRDSLVQFTVKANLSKLKMAAARRGEELDPVEEAQMVEEVASFAKQVFSKRWNDMSLREKSVYVRAYDTFHFSRAYSTVTPEGNKGPVAVTETGKVQRVAWQSYGVITKALSIYYDGSPTNISHRLGQAHKVRNFYNNIADPNAEEDYVTIDTHAVAAALLEALSGTSPQVMQIFSSAKRSTKSGLQGPYAVYAQAYHELASELSVELGRKILSRELQSVTWEAVRLLFTRGQKREAFVKSINSLWTSHKKGTLSADALRNKIRQKAGGLGRPGWSPAQQELAFDEGILSEGDVFPGVPGVPRERGGPGGDSPGIAGGDSRGLDGLVEATPIRSSISNKRRHVFNAQPTRDDFTQTEVDRIVKVANQFVPTNKIKIGDDRAALQLLADISVRDGPLQQRIANAVRREFPDRLNSPDIADNEHEARVLRAVVLQSIMGNAIAVAHRFYIRPGQDNKKRASKLYNAAKEAAYASVVQVSGDRYTAARILRAAQISADGNVAFILFHMMEGINQYLYRKTGVTKEDLDHVEDVGKRAKRGVVADVVMGSTPEGREVINLRERVKSKLRKVASWLGITSESRERLPLMQQSLVGEIKVLMDKINIDYRGNIEELLTKLEVAVDELQGSEQVQALLDLRAAVREDERLAHQEFEVLGDSLRKLDAAAQRFIDDAHLKYRFGTNKESMILSKIRTEVRAGRMTPEQGGDAFIAAKGDKRMRAALIGALERDKESITQQEELAADAAEIDKLVEAEQEDDQPEADPAAAVAALAADLLDRELSRDEFKGRRDTTVMQDANALLRKYATADPTVTKTAVLTAYAEAGLSGPLIEQALNLAEGARILRRDVQERAAAERYLKKVTAAEAAAAARQRAKEASLAKQHADVQAAAVAQAEALALKALGVAKTPGARTARQEAAQARSRYVTGKPETEASVRSAYERAGYDSETIDTIIPILQVAREANRDAREKAAEEAFFQKRKQAAEDRVRKAQEEARQQSNALVDQGQRLIDSALGLKPSKKGKTTKQEANSLRSQYVHSKNGVSKEQVRRAYLNAGFEDNADLQKMLDYAEGARLLRRDDDQAKAAAKFAARSAKGAKKSADKIEDLAASVFKPGSKSAGRGSPIPGLKRKTTVSEDILNAINDNPEWDIADESDKIKIIQELLIRRVGLTEADAKVQAGKLVKEFNAKLSDILTKEAAKLSSKFARGKVTENDLRQAIRLHLLDPSSSLATTLAATKGWKGLTDAELSELSSALESAEDIHDPQVRLSILLKQMRIVLRASGVEPETHAIISSAVRASAYSGAGSIMLNFTVPVLMGGVVQPMREYLTSVLANPTKIPEITRSTIRAMSHAVGNAVASARIAAKFDATLGLSAAKDTAGPESVGVLAIDSLTARMDIALDRINDSNLSKARKAWEYVMLGITAQRVLWKILGAADSAGIALIQEFLTEMKINQDLRKEGRDPSKEFDAFMDAVGRGARWGVDALGLTPLQAHKEMLTRAREGYYQYLLTGGKVDGFEVHQDARREALSIMGNHEEVQGTISVLGNWLAKLISNPKLLGLGSWLTGPVRIIANVMDMAVWLMPGYNIVRYIREKNAQEKGEGRFMLHAGSSWQLQRRFHEVVAGNMITAILVGLLAAQDDDDPWFEVTGAYPLDPAERARWQQQGISEYTMYFGSRKGRRYQIRFTRGALEFLVMPAIVANYINKVRRGKSTIIGGFANNVLYDTANVGVPAIENMSNAWVEARRGNDKDLYKELAFRTSTLLPFSGTQRSLAKLGETPSKDSGTYLWSQLIPISAVFTKADIQFKNSLDEDPFDTKSVWNTLSRLGLPTGFITPSKPKDELLAKDFSAMNYAPAFPESYRSLSQDVPGITPQQYSEFVSRRAAVFKKIYRSDPEPGDLSKDPRFLKDILRMGDREAYKERMSSYWSRATRQAKVDMGLVEED